MHGTTEPHSNLERIFPHPYVQPLGTRLFIRTTLTGVVQSTPANTTTRVLAYTKITLHCNGSKIPERWILGQHLIY